MFKIKRIYEKFDKNDGIRILVDRLWPRGLAKENARIDKWMKEVTPSDRLRKWFSHREKRWKEFKTLYLEELENKKDFINELKILSKNKTVTLLFAARDKDRNNAKVLSEFLKK